MVNFDEGTNKHLIILLGNRNDKSTQLFQIVKDRATKAVDLVDIAEQTYILPTGGWGEHFNVTSRAHAELVTEYLTSFSKVRQLVADGKLNVVNYTRSNGTHQDAWLAFRRLSELEEKVGRFSKLSVVTSSFHIERVKLIFGNVFNLRDINYVSVTHSEEALNEKEEDDNPNCTLEEHEKNAIEEYIKYGVLMHWNPDKLQDGYINLGDELRHYDKLSYFAIFASFATAYSFFKLTLSWPWVLPLVFVFLCFQLLLGKLYIRLAETSSACRKIMEAVEMAYGVPGISNINRPEINLRGRISKNKISKYFYRINNRKGIADVVLTILFIISVCSAVAAIAPHWPALKALVSRAI